MSKGKTSIEWTERTWNPLFGCRKPSPGCANCYAETMAKRLRAMAQADQAKGKDPGRKRYYLDVVDDRGHWTGKVLPVPELLSEPLEVKKPARWFVNSMSDLFFGDEGDRKFCEGRGIPFEPVPFAFIDRVFGVMALCPQHTFQILTKRPGRMLEYFQSDPVARIVAGMHECVRGNVPGEMAALSIHHQLRVAGGWPLPNVWLGTSVEDQKRADERIPALLRCPAAVRWLSIEPLLGSVDLERCLWIDCPHQNVIEGYGCADCQNYPGLPSRALDWVVVGGESGPKARPMHPEWVRSLRDQCLNAGVPFFFKQWGAWIPKSHTTLRHPWHAERTPDDGGWRVAVDGQKASWGSLAPDGQFDRGATPWNGHDDDGYGSREAVMYRLDKKSSGRHLDGRTWDEYPEAAHV